MWFRRHRIEQGWDSNAAKNRWRDSELRGRGAFEKVFPSRPPSEDPNGFYDLCLAEMDGLAELNRTQRFASLADFVVELRRIQAEPTTPSVPAFDLQVYRACQKQWLDFMIRSTVAESRGQKRDWVPGLLALPIFGFLALGVFLLLRAFDAEQARPFGLLQWQALVGSLFCLFLCGLICKFIEKRSKIESDSETVPAIETPK